jgi:hypothetical protein
MIKEPHKIYYEEAALNYELGKFLREKYKHLEWIPIENHNNIPFLRANPNSEFLRMKQDIVVAVRKTHNYVPNYKTSDYLVPYTSSGCSAACLYCYLVCNYNKCSYLSLFVNREQMLDKIIKTAKSIVVSGPMGVYENKQFNYGTKGVLQAIADSKAFSLAGGGNTIAAIAEYGLTKKIGYISTAGGALIEFLMGKKLPGVVALENAVTSKKI